MPPFVMASELNSASSPSSEERDSNTAGPGRDGEEGGTGHRGTKRRVKNRDAARKSRKKQTERADELHQELQCLEQSNSAFQKEIAALKKQLQFYTTALESHEPSCCLRRSGSSDKPLVSPSLPAYNLKGDSSPHNISTSFNSVETHSTHTTPATPPSAALHSLLHEDQSSSIALRSSTASDCITLMSNPTIPSASTQPPDASTSSGSENSNFHADGPLLIPRSHEATSTPTAQTQNALSMKHACFENESNKVLPAVADKASLEAHGFPTNPPELQHDVFRNFQNLNGSSPSCSPLPPLLPDFDLLSFLEQQAQNIPPSDGAKLSQQTKHSSLVSLLTVPSLPSIPQTSSSSSSGPPASQTVLVDPSRHISLSELLDVDVDWILGGMNDM